MKDGSKARQNVIIQFGIWSVTVCLAAGLAMDMRPLVILGRSIASFAVAGMLGYVLVSVIQIHSSVRKEPTPDKAEGPAEPDEQEEQNKGVNAAEPQSDQVAQESDA